MEAKDTVMRDAQIARAFDCPGDELIPSDWDLHSRDDLRDVARTQAEISFKLGKTAGVAESLLPAVKAIEKSRREGIKLVVEWIKKYEDKTVLIDDKDNPVASYFFEEGDLKAKLKEWEV